MNTVPWLSVLEVALPSTALVVIAFAAGYRSGKIIGYRMGMRHDLLDKRTARLDLRYFGPRS